MSRNRIERSSDLNRGITGEEIKAGLAETERRKAQPGYHERQATEAAEIERRSRGLGCKFPDLANRRNSSLAAGKPAPVLASCEAMLDLLR